MSVVSVHLVLWGPTDLRSGSGGPGDAALPSPPPSPLYLVDVGAADSLRVVDLTRASFVLHGFGPRQVAHHSCLAPLGTHTHECLACTEVLPASGFTQEFCFAHYRVEAHVEEKWGPRHRRTVCDTCLRAYCGREVDAGKLFVKCPCCPRALQTRELR